MMLSSITDNIAPVDAMATRPKLSFSDALLSFFNAEMPTESDSINGTARIPVVAPDASNATAKNSGDVKNGHPENQQIENEQYFVQRNIVKYPYKPECHHNRKPHGYHHQNHNAGYGTGCDLIYLICQHQQPGLCTLTQKSREQVPATMTSNSLLDLASAVPGQVA